MALDGSEDHKIYHDLRPFWDELGMAKLREDSRIMHRSKNKTSTFGIASHTTKKHSVCKIFHDSTAQHVRCEGIGKTC